MRTRPPFFTALFIALIALVTLPAQTARAADIVYTVQPGDSLSEIARRYDVSLAELLAANDIPDPDHIRAGDRLTIPGGREPSELSGPEATNPALSTATQPTTAGGSGLYQVKAGDSLYKLSRRFNVSENEIRAANDIAGDTIYVGQQLTIPAAASVATTAHNYTGVISGADDYVALMNAVLDWLAVNDPDALERVRYYVSSIQPSPALNLAWARLRGATCAVEVPATSLQLTASILYHEASHCEQWFQEGVVSEAAGEWYAYGQQVEFMRRHNFQPALIHFYEQVRTGFAP